MILLFLEQDRLRNLEYASLLPFMSLSVGDSAGLFALDLVFIIRVVSRLSFFFLQIKSSGSDISPDLQILRLQTRSEFFSQHYRSNLSSNP
jgi:hypothetical protein